MRSYLRHLQAEISTRTAVVGDGDGNVLVSGRPNYVYARLGGTVVEVRATVWANELVEDETLLVQRDTGAGLAQWRAVFKL